MLQLTTKTVEETEQIGEQLGKLAGPGMVVLLTGELGAGKTAFARGVARGLGCLLYTSGRRELPALWCRVRCHIKRIPS